MAGGWNGYGAAAEEDESMTHERLVFAAALLLSAPSALAMGGGGGGKSWNGFTPPHVAPIHKNMGTTMMVVMWLWLFYRAKEDGMSVLGLREPWEHGGGHRHVDVGTINYESPGVGEMPVAGGDGEEEH